ncbi:MAG: GTP-binding protein [Proteobacteria bacterium]|nr:GTP-binding protein [Pseudomonadota bacterium]
MKTPFTILTGWLGAGKTTALNRMLGVASGKRIAVLVNELGRIAIDTRLIVGRGSDVLELAGGCVCCSIDVKNDLWDGIGDVVARTQPDHVVLETTGIAEPAAILEGLVRRGSADNDADGIRRPRSRGELLLDRIVPAGVVCVVDAEAGADALATRDEARNQAATADRVLIAKLDVASPEAVARCHARLDALAPHAERAAFPDAEARAMMAWVVEPRELRAWQAGTRRAEVGEGHGHHHHNQLVAISFADDAPLVGARVLAVISQLGDRLVRAKGFVHLADHTRGFVERAGIRTDLRDAGAWPGPPRTELVLIGDGLDEAAIRRALWACRSGS